MIRVGEQDFGDKVKLELGMNGGCFIFDDLMLFLVLLVFFCEDVYGS